MCHAVRRARKRSMGLCLTPITLRAEGILMGSSVRLKRGKRVKRRKKKRMN
jgi:hypothetical protein